MRLIWNRPRKISIRSKNDCFKVANSKKSKVGMEEAETVAESHQNGASSQRLDTLRNVLQVSFPRHVC